MPGRREASLRWPVATCTRTPGRADFGASARAAQFARVATRETVGDSGLELGRLDPARVGVSVGSAVGCTIKLETEYLVLSDSGREWLVDHGYTSPHLYDYYMPGSIATEVAWEVNAQGPVAMVSAGFRADNGSVPIFVRQLSGPRPAPPDWMKLVRES